MSTKGRNRMIEGASVNVLDFGADPTGVNDSTSAFQAAVDAATPINPSESSVDNNVPMAPSKSVYVPAGVYRLTSLIKNSNCSVTFNCEPNVRFSNSRLLDGRIDKDSYHVNSVAKGHREMASGFSTRAFAGTHTPPAIQLDSDGGTYGITSPILSGRGGDLVAQTAQAIQGSTYTFLTGTTFTATSCLFTTIVNSVKENLQIGSLLWAKTANSFGMITAINGTSITVGNWGNGTPINGDTVLVDFYRKIWGSNINALSYPESSDLLVNVAGQEIGVRTEQDVSSNVLGGVYPYMWGQDITNLHGDVKAGSVGQIVRGNWLNGYVSAGGYTGFATMTTRGSDSSGNTVGFLHQAEGSVAFKANDVDKVDGVGTGFLAQTNGVLQLGYADGTYGSTFIDFRTQNSDFDGRITVQGGNAGVTGQSVMIYNAAGGHSFVGNVLPNGSGRTCGSTVEPWDSVHAVNGTIQPSDERLKQDIELLNAAEQRVALVCKGLIRKYRLKQDTTKLHVGVIAQRIQEAFAAEGLDALDYGILNHDMWEDQYTMSNDKEPVQILSVPANDQYSVQYTELLCFIIAAI